MGKQHGQDKMYLSASEWKALGGYKGAGGGGEAAKLPLHCCCLTLRPFEHPVCSPEGHIFELEAIVPFVQKYHKNPVTDGPLELNQLVKLHFARDKETDELQCAATQETFSESTHVVALRTTGNVYAYSAIDQLCLKPKTLRDLLDDSPFTKADIITLQDPHNIEKRLAGNFAHVANESTAKQVESVKAGNGAAAGSQAASSASAVAPAAARPAAAPGGRPRPMLGISLAPKPSGAAAAAASLGIVAGPARGLYSSGAVSGSLTSTAMSVATVNERSFLTPEQILEQRYADLRKKKSKGYVRLTTTLGPINLELHCDQAPRTCHNFMELCERQYYKDTIIHRVIPGFMAQMGDPDGTGRGGEGAFERNFKDEFNSALRHDSRGVVAMANSGPNTNGSQFYITFAAAPHLDNKHSVFGRVVGGTETLDALERVETVQGKNESKPKDAPRAEVKITAVTVYTNPYKEEFKPVDALTRQAEGEATGGAAAAEAEEERGAWFSNPTAQAVPKQGGDDKFKYLSLPQPTQVGAAGVSLTTAAARKGKRKESPNAAETEGQLQTGSAAHPAIRAAAAAAGGAAGVSSAPAAPTSSPGVPMDTTMTPRGGNSGSGGSELDPDAHAFEQAKRRAQQAAVAQQTNKQAGYGNFGNW